MNDLPSWRDQARSNIKSVCLIFFCGLVIVLSVAGFHTWRSGGKGYNIRDLMRDPADILDYPVYLGGLSQIGIFLWTAAATVSILAGTIIAKRDSRQLLLGRFLFFLGLFTLWLGLDDCFLIHERILPRLGIPDPAVMCAYVLVMFLFLALFRRAILATPCILLALSFAFFALSVLFDCVTPVQVPLAEDGAKATGIVALLVYSSKTAYLFLTAREKSPAQSVDAVSS